MTNDNIESVLGSVNGRPSRSRSIVLKSNRIESRYYAIDPITRVPTHTNAQLTAEAVKTLFARNPDLSIDQVEFMGCGTSAADLLVPAHGQMVQGLLPKLSAEVVTTTGVCCSSMAALKMAYLNVLSGECSRALVTGSEAASKFMRAEFLESESEVKISELKKNPMVAFEYDFLRWMLSDGAGAFYLSDSVIPGKINLRLNWMHGHSYANEAEVCMFAGGHRDDNGVITAWKDLRLQPNSENLNFAMNFRQDIRQLRDLIPLYSIEKPLTDLKKKRGIKPGDYKWFLPHFSSHFFLDTLRNALAKVDFQIPEERWFTSLYERGNVGSASMLVFVDELLRQKGEELRSGDKILCYIPESARFSVYYFELEVV